MGMGRFIHYLYEYDTQFFSRSSMLNHRVFVILCRSSMLNCRIFMIHGTENSVLKLAGDMLRCIDAVNAVHVCHMVHTSLFTSVFSRDDML